MQNGTSYRTHIFTSFQHDVTYFYWYTEYYDVKKCAKNILKIVNNISILKSTRNSEWSRNTREENPNNLEENVK